MSHIIKLDTDLDSEHNLLYLVIINRTAHLVSYELCADLRLGDDEIVTRPHFRFKKICPFGLSYDECSTITRAVYKARDEEELYDGRIRWWHDPIQVEQIRRGMVDGLLVRAFTHGVPIRGIPMETCLELSVVSLRFMLEHQPEKIAKVLTPRFGLQR